MILINEEVKHALENNIPVVALESTIISHGMPYPKNVETALKVEQVIRENGAIPATIGIIDGVGIVGMTPDQIEEFGKRKGIVKVSRRDVPVPASLTAREETFAFISLVSIFEISVLMFGLPW